jgi:hypothetical protein
MPAAARLARALALLLVAAFAGMPAALAQDEGTLERRVKAAFLYKFTGYVAWPDGTFARPDTPLVIGIMGDDALAGETAQVVAGRTLDGRPLQVRRVAAAEQAAGVHMLFVARSETPRFAQLLKALPAAPLLIVTESEVAFRQGGAINFVVVDGRVRFEVALEPAERRGLRMSSRLLAVAINVQGAP